MARLTRINHIAITSDDMEHSLRLWRDCLGLEVKRVEDVPGMNLVVAFLPIGESNVEFLLPMKAWEDVDPMYTERMGMNHICFEVDNIEEMISCVKQNGIRLVQDIPLKLPGRKLAFLDPSCTDGILIELYELTPGQETTYSS